MSAHTPSSLLPLVAAAGARWDGRLSEMFKWPGPEPGEVQKYMPWAPIHFDVISTATKNNFIADTSQVKALQAAAPEVGGEMRRFGFNPLLSKPVITGVVPTVSLIPVPHLLVRKASPLGVYFAGMQKWGVEFSQDVGTFLEAYVGRQLELSGGQVAPAAEYRRSGAKAETVDWSVVFNDVVFLVEVKSVRPTEPVRVGDSAAATELTRMLSKAIKQVNTTTKMVLERHPALGHIPNDRPVVGLVVTLEPFHTVNSPLLDQWLPKADVPLSVCSVAELEHLMQIADASVGTAVLTAITDPDKAGWSIRTAVGHHSPGRNPVLDAGYEALPWRGDQAHD